MEKILLGATSVWWFGTVARKHTHLGSHILVPVLARVMFGVEIIENTLENFKEKLIKTTYSFPPR